MLVLLGVGLCAAVLTALIIVFLNNNADTDNAAVSSTLATTTVSSTSLTNTATTTLNGSGGGTSPGEIGLKAINAFRAQQNVPPLTYNTAAQACADKCAENDAAKGFHDSVHSGSRNRLCEAGQGQCEARGADVLKSVKMFTDEGPGGGHYEILRGARYKSVAIGSASNGRFWTFNFYS